MTEDMSYQVNVDEQTITIRPITNNDIDLERNFIDNLSAQTKHYRFLGGVNHLSTEQLVKLCDIDYDHRMAFIASVTTNGVEEEIGVSRYATDTNNDNCEFAITIADKWQDKGLGKILMEKLISFAKEHDVKRLYSMDLADNAHMRQLAHDLGMQAKRDPDDAHQVIYSIALDEYK